jgi:prepilin-type N-terminal cleavage/methylation domain-containing protein
MKAKKKLEKGFSLLESLLVVAVVGVMTGIAILGSAGPMQTYTANAAMDVISSQLRIARQISISQRRYVKVVVDPVAKTISYQTYSLTFAPEGLLTTVPLPPRTGFILETGIPDTPMAFGNTSAILIGGVSGGPPSGMYFTPTGSFSDGTFYNAVNGTIFIGVPNQPSSARAVTILGSTGRIRPYVWSSSHWTE